MVGITGTGGAGKSSLTDELVRRFLDDFDDKTVAVICADPTRRRTGGALLGDRIRFNTLKSPRVFMRSVATRGAKGELSEAMAGLVKATRRDFDLVFLETAGIGQGDSSVTEYCDLSLYVMTAEYGAPSQLEKIDMLDYADFVAINKFTRRGSEDALRDVRKQFQRNHELFSTPAEELPIFGTSAAHFNDPGVNALYGHLVAKVIARFDRDWQSHYPADAVRVTDSARSIIPPGRERYLAEVAETCRAYRAWAEEQAALAQRIEGLRIALAELGVELGAKTGESWQPLTEDAAGSEGSVLAEHHDRLLAELAPECRRLVGEWPSWDKGYDDERFVYQVRGKDVEVENYRRTLSGLPVRKVARPGFRAAGDRLRWRLLENVPGEFPYTGGVFPFKRQAEDPTRMFAGEGTSERTNRRFHYLADSQPAKRLSTAFDSLTLYGPGPSTRYLRQDR